MKKSVYIASMLILNWGWDGTSNGWYAFDNWAPSGTNFNFQYYRRAIINIHP